MIAIGRDGGANPSREQPHPVFNAIVLKQMSLLCEFSYLFNSKMRLQNIWSS